MGQGDMTKWEFSMINRDEYERVCKENRELKADLRNLINRINKVGETLDSVGAVETVGESREQTYD
jgi:hypothetical protein